MKCKPRKGFRCLENVAHTRQSRPDYGFGFQATVLEIKLFPFRSEAAVIVVVQRLPELVNEIVD